MDTKEKSIVAAAIGGARIKWMKDMGRVSYHEMPDDVLAEAAIKALDEYRQRGARPNAYPVACADHLEKGQSFADYLFGKGVF